MVDNTKDYIIKLRLDTSELTKEYPKVQKKLQKAADKVNASLEKEIKLRRIANQLTSQQGNLLERQQRQAEKAARRAEKIRPAPTRTVNTEAISRREARRRVNREVPARPLGGSEQLGVDIEDLGNRAGRARISDPTLKGQLAGQQAELGNIQSRLAAAKSTREVKQLRKEYGGVNQEIRRIVRAQERYNRKLSESNRLAGKFKGSVGRMVGGLASIYMLTEAARAIYTVGREMDSMRAALLAASAGAEEAAQNFEFLKDTSRDLGKDIQGSVGGFNRIGVAAKSAGFNAAETREIFLAAAEGATTFGLDAQRSGLVMLAMSQIMSEPFAHVKPI